MDMKVRIKIHSLKRSISKRGLEEQGRVQKFIDGEVLRLSDPYVPMLSGDLKNSGPVHTAVGSGVVRYKTPYARKQYYTNAGMGSEGTGLGGRRGKKWFERMKANHLEEILDGALKESGK